MSTNDDKKALTVECPRCRAKPEEQCHRVVTAEGYGEAGDARRPHGYRHLKAAGAVKRQGWF